MKRSIVLTLDEGNKPIAPICDKNFLTDIAHSLIKFTFDNFFNPLKYFFRSN